MRVIAGEFRSRRLKTLPGFDVRPSPDRLREALFNVLAPRIDGATFVDAYAGTGSVGIEALSRGATRVVFVELNPAAVHIIRENLAALGIEGRAEVIRGKAAPALSRVSAGIVFIDPPYSLDLEYEASLTALGRNPPELAIVQHFGKRQLAERYGKLVRSRVLKQGENALTFYSAAE